MTEPRVLTPCTFAELCAYLDHYPRPLQIVSLAGLVMFSDVEQPDPIVAMHSASAPSSPRPTGCCVWCWPPRMRVVLVKGRDRTPGIVRGELSGNCVVSWPNGTRICAPHTLQLAT